MTTIEPKKALWRMPTGFSDPSEYVYEVLVVGFVEGECEDWTRSYGKFKGTMAILDVVGKKKPYRYKGSLMKAPIDQIFYEEDRYGE